MYRSDPRPNRIDLGVGVYRDELGKTPVMSAVKRAEHELLEQQESKSYLGPEGDLGFVEGITQLVLGTPSSARTGRVAGVQSPGGTGALRLGFELVRRANPEARVLVGRPTWANHEPILSAVGLEVLPYRYFDPASQTVLFDELLGTLAAARPGDVVLLHGSCHNPTGADLSPDHWGEVARMVAERDLVPFIDVAYLGLGRGVEEDAAGLRRVIEAAPEALVSVSCSKSFGLYRERTGALLVAAPSSSLLEAARTNILAIARANYSMPPDHGAAVVRTILHDAALHGKWLEELSTMRSRIDGLRRRLCAALDEADVGFADLRSATGMFSMLPLGSGEIQRLREERGIYMAGDGRINVAGFATGQIEAFTAALQHARLWRRELASSETASDRKP